MLRACVDDRAAACLADFDRKLAEKYAFDEKLWDQIGQAAQDILIDASVKLHGKCKELGLPGQYAPAIELAWAGRGQTAVDAYRAALRRMAKTTIEAMAKRAMTKIEHMSLDLRTQVVAMGLLSADAKLFLESLAPIDETMRSLEFSEVEIAVEQQRLRFQRGQYE